MVDAPGRVRDLYVPEGVIVEGENTLTLTRGSGGTLKLDQVELGGSWQYGLDAASMGISSIPATPHSR